MLLLSAYCPSISHDSQCTLDTSQVMARVLPVVSRAALVLICCCREPTVHPPVTSHSAQSTRHKSQCTFHTSQCTFHMSQVTMHTFHTSQCTFDTSQVTRRVLPVVSCAALVWIRCCRPHALHPQTAQQHPAHQGTHVRSQSSFSIFFPTKVWMLAEQIRTQLRRKCGLDPITRDRHLMHILLFVA